MDFVDWTSKVLNDMVAARRASSDVRTFGMTLLEVSVTVFGAGVVDTLAFLDADHATCQSKALLTALYGLQDLGLVEQFGLQGSHWRVSETGRESHADLTPVWQSVCAKQLEPDCVELLRVVNRLSPREEDTFTWLDSVSGNRLLNELQWPGGLDHVRAAVEDLERLGLVTARIYLGAPMEVRATYRGLVWETRQGLTLESQFIDRLVAEWETTSVDFKRELLTDTKDQKAEFIKDVLGLANTQASGRRWMIIGFDDRTRTYHGPPSAKIKQDHLEHLVNRYISPNLGIRYEVVAYRAGDVGKLEVLREPAKLPYKASASLGDKKRVTAGDWFVRHGSQTEKPTEAEARAIEDEGERARAG